MNLQKEMQGFASSGNYYRPHITLQQPVVVTSSKVKENPSILKAALGGQGKGPAGKGKGTKPPNKGRKNVVKPLLSKAVTSTCPSTSPKDKTKDKPKITAYDTRLG